MKKVLSLIVLSFIFLISVGFSTPELMTTKQDDPLHSIFYKENRITNTDYVVASDSSGNPLSLSDIFEGNNLAPTINSSNYTVGSNITDFEFLTDGGIRFVGSDPFATSLNAISVNETLLPIYSDFGDYYTAFIVDTNSIDAQFGYRWYDNINKPTIEISESLYKRNMIYSSVDDVQSFSQTSDRYRFGAYNNTELYVYNFYTINLDTFETERSQSDLDQWLEIYTEIEENGTYYYYTFDGSVISIIWVAMLFSGVIYYVRQSERDTSSAVVYGAIFFIVGTALLRVIQVII